MIECIFTLDYEIYGNGQGSLRRLVYEPAETLKTIFERYKARFMPFVEAAEIEMIEKEGADPDIDAVKHQIREFHEDGFELGLHIHPQWCNAKYESGEWRLDYREYSLCSLPRERIAHIIGHSLEYIRNIVGDPNYIPLSFRAGNWIFQPTGNAADILAEVGIKVDSSVYKGGRQHMHHLDYRRAVRNGYYWTFKDHVDLPDPHGKLIELPVYTEMVPIWKIFTTKRIDLQRKQMSASQTLKQRVHRIRELLRFRYPMKFDYCRMTITELTRMVDKVIQEDEKNPSSYKPIVAIGHTKDLVDIETIDLLLSYLTSAGIKIATVKEVYAKFKQQ